MGGRGQVRLHEKMMLHRDLKMVRNQPTDVYESCSGKRIVSAKALGLEDA